MYSLTLLFLNSFFDDPISNIPHTGPRVPLNITGTISIGVSLMDVRWQALGWDVNTMSRKVRTEAGRRGQRHQTQLQGVHAPAAGKQLCGKSTIRLKLTRGFSIVQLTRGFSIVRTTENATSAGLQLTSETISRAQLDDGVPCDQLSFVFQFVISENMQVERTVPLLSRSARASLTLSLFISALSVLKVVKMVTQVK